MYRVIDDILFYDTDDAEDAVNMLIQEEDFDMSNYELDEMSSEEYDIWKNSKIEEERNKMFRKVYKMDYEDEFEWGARVLIRIADDEYYDNDIQYTCYQF